MTNHKQALADTLEARNILSGLIHSAADSLTNPDRTPRAKIYAAHAITHLAQASADLTRLRRELQNPGGKP